MDVRAVNNTRLELLVTASLVALTITAPTAHQDSISPPCSSVLGLLHGKKSQGDRFLVGTREVDSSRAAKEKEKHTGFEADPLRAVAREAVSYNAISREKD